MPPRSSSPSWKRKVPSTRQPIAAFWPASHRFWWPVAGFHSCDRGTDCFDHAGTLVAADEREAGGAGGPDVLVGMTQAGRLEPDEDLAGLGLIQV
jgi:hypothetical protein